MRCYRTGQKKTRSGRRASESWRKAAGPQPMAVPHRAEERGVAAERLRVGGRRQGRSRLGGQQHQGDDRREHHRHGVSGWGKVVLPGQDVL